MNSKWMLLLIAGSVWVISLISTYLFFLAFQMPTFFALISLSNYQSFIIWTFIFSAFLASAFYFLFGRRIDKINQRLAILIEKNEYVERFDVKGSDSISTLTENLNTILDNVLISDERLEHKVKARTKKLLERIDDIEASLSHREKEKNELIIMNENLVQMAHFDKLTSLPTRVLFSETFNKALIRSKLENKKLGLLIISIDNFKSINDSLGRSVGDTILTEVVTRLKKMIRSEDMLARSGGSEFNVLLNDIVYPEFCSLVADKILKNFSDKIKINGRIIHLIFNIGIAVFPEDGISLEELFNNADIAMFKTKRATESSFTCFQKDMRLETTELVKFSKVLDKAIADKEFVLYYQPQLNLKDGSIIGVEALLRWESPTLGLISPSRFIRMAEDTGFIVHLGEWVLHEACRVNKAWQKQGLMTIPISINLSLNQFLYQDISEVVAKTLKKTDLDAKYLDLELSSSILMNCSQSKIDSLKSIADMGVKITLDEFGYGPLSINLLQQLPIQMLKIDQRFIKGLTTNQEDADITKAVINIGNTLGLKVAATGIETVEQLQYLIEHNCHLGQGYFFNKPLPESEFVSSCLYLDDAGVVSEKIK